MPEPLKSTVCPICGRRLMQFKVTDSRPTSSGQQRVQIRQCPEHPKVRAGALVKEISLAEALRFIARVRNREKRKRRTPQDVGANVDRNAGNG
jgi:transcriptional regulator NrdR family protein